jgi:hypothetical protein
MGADGDFDAFNGFADELAQGAVKMVEVPEVIEGRAGEELIGIALDGDWEAVGGKAVVIEVFEAVKGAGFVGNNQAAAFEDCKLLGVGFGGLVAAHAQSPEMSNAPIWALLRGLARIVKRTIGRRALFVNPEKCLFLEGTGLSGRADAGEFIELWLGMWQRFLAGG